MPEELHESAAIDGCNKWQQFWRVTLPTLDADCAHCFGADDNRVIQNVRACVCHDGRRRRRELDRAGIRNV